MTPSARLAAAIEVLDQVAASRTPADELLAAWGRAHRFAGSKDRRAIAERVYACLRGRAGLAWRMADEGGRALVIAALAVQDGLAADEIAALFSGEGHAPRPLTPEEVARLAAPPASAAPDWVQAGVPQAAAALLQTTFGDDWIAEARALIGARAPLDLRVNALRGPVEGAMALLSTDGLAPVRTPWSAWGLRLAADLAADVQRLRAFATGWVEVQDEASQIAAALAGARPGDTVVDYCAGGGGKTLAFAAAMRRSGRLVALDVNPRRLQAMRPRLERADARAEVRRLAPDGRGGDDGLTGDDGLRGDDGRTSDDLEALADLEGLADLVFVDAPCSGSGTWRRHPEAALRLTGETVARLAAQQQAILARAAGLVRPGGRLAYATCSVLAAENGAVAEAFAAARPNFRPYAITRAADTPALTGAGRARLVELAGDRHTLQLTPRRTATDGFFLALFQRDA